MVFTAGVMQSSGNPVEAAFKSLRFLESEAKDNARPWSHYELATPVVQRYVLLTKSLKSENFPI